jgi:hypothetical protein
MMIIANMPPAIANWRKLNVNDSWASKPEMSGPVKLPK